MTPREPPPPYVVLPGHSLEVPNRRTPSFRWAGRREDPSEWLLSFHVPDKARVWSINERIHWRTRSALAGAWRHAAAEAAGPVTLGPGRWYVQLSLPFRRAAPRRDPHNFVGTVVKAVIDGLTDAGLWADDTPEFVVNGDPILRVCPLKERRLMVVGVHALRMHPNNGD